jgi:hypothetical protein
MRNALGTYPFCRSVCFSAYLLDWQVPADQGTFHNPILMSGADPWFQS